MASEQLDLPIVLEEEEESRPVSPKAKPKGTRAAPSAYRKLFHALVSAGCVRDTISVNEGTHLVRRACEKASYVLVSRKTLDDLQKCQNSE